MSESYKCIELMKRSGEHDENDDQTFVLSIVKNFILAVPFQRHQSIFQKPFIDNVDDDALCTFIALLVYIKRFRVS